MSFYFQRSVLIQPKTRLGKVDKKRIIKLFIRQLAVQSADLSAVVKSSIIECKAAFVAPSVHRKCDVYSTLSFQCSIMLAETNKIIRRRLGEKMIGAPKLPAKGERTGKLELRCNMECTVYTISLPMPPSLLETIFRKLD